MTAGLLLAGEAAAELCIPLRASLSLTDQLTLPTSSPPAKGLSALHVEGHNPDPSPRVEALVLLCDGSLLLLSPPPRSPPLFPPMAGHSEKSRRRPLPTSPPSPPSPFSPQTVEMAIAVRPPGLEEAMRGDGGMSLGGGGESGVGDLAGYALVPLLPRESACFVWQVPTLPLPVPIPPYSSPSVLPPSPLLSFFDRLTPSYALPPPTPINPAPPIMHSPCPPLPCPPSAFLHRRSEALPGHSAGEVCGSGATNTSPPLPPTWGERRRPHA